MEDAMSDGDTHDEAGWTLAEIEAVWRWFLSHEGDDPKCAFARAERVIPKWRSLVDAYRKFSKQPQSETIYTNTRHVEERMKQNAVR